MYGLLPTQTGGWTPGELAQYCEAGLKRQRSQAHMLYTHAQLCAMAVKGELPEIWDAFPLWSDEEIAAKRIERMKAAMLRKSKPQQS